MARFLKSVRSVQSDDLSKGARAFRSRTESENDRTTSNASTGVREALAELAALRDDGLVTEEEYARKRAAILDRL